jgi:hypothetical protein
MSGKSLKKMELVLIRDKINRLNVEVKSLKQKLNVIEKEKSRILNRIMYVENSVKRLVLDRDCIANYCKIKKTCKIIT